MGEVLKIFISATSADLGAVRVAATQALTTRRCLAIVQEHLGPSPDTILETLRRSVEESDAVLHIVGECHGSPPPDPELPSRSYTQWEYHYALQYKKPLYLFVCAPGFPYLPHPAETARAQELQRQHRAAVVAPGGPKYELIPDLATFEKRVRDFDLDRRQLGAELRRTRRHGRLIGGAIAAALALLTAVIVWKSQEIIRRIPPAPAVVPGDSFDPVRIKANLEKRIQERAAEETAKLDPVSDWEKIAEIEKTRDRQLADVDRAVDQIGQVFEKKEASANFAIATRLLAEKGVAEALRFLESKSGLLERKIAALKGGLELTERVRAAQESELREALREKLLAADLLVQDAQWDKAEAAYRAVVRDGGTWPEPRNQLAQLLWQRGAIIEPADGNRKLREAIELSQETLAANPRAADSPAWADAQATLASASQYLASRVGGAESLRLLGEAVTAHRAALEVNTRAQSPQAWALTQHNLGNALLEQGMRAEAAESLRLLGEAVAAYRAALEVRTRAELPQAWALTQNNLGTALSAQGDRAHGAESLRLLGESEAAYRAVLEVYTREQFPQNWAGTQKNLGTVLWVQCTRSEGAESLRLLGEAVTAYRAALEVYTREQFPQHWASTQIGIANALAQQAARAEGAESLRLLGEAVAAYRAALEVNTRAELPQDWAATQNNLAIALAEQGARAEGSERLRLLREAVAAGRAALEVRTRAHLPQDWRNSMHNLAIDLRLLAEHARQEEAAKLRAEAEGIDKELAEP